jgi:hypothetical protein
VAIARAELESDDLAARMWAILHLVEHGAASDTVEALRSTIADPRTSAEARQYATRFARRRGLLRRAEVRELVASARSAESPGSPLATR